MKRIILISIVFVLFFIMLSGCSDYVAFVELGDTGVSITPEQMVEISKEMQQTTAAPLGSSSTETVLTEPVQSDAVTVAPSAIESSVIDPVQTAMPVIETTPVAGSSTTTTVCTETLPAESTTHEPSFVYTTPVDTTTAIYQPIETTAVDTTTVDAGNETPIVPIETIQTSPSVNGDKVDDSNFVYWTPGGSVWHTTSNCSSLSRSKEIVSGSVAEAQAAGKDRVCKRCG